MKSLNESPSEKEGKWARLLRVNGAVEVASMKVPPKRKGNTGAPEVPAKGCCLNESPSEKEGKYGFLNQTADHLIGASMKVPPKRKGNLVPQPTPQS